MKKVSINKLVRNRKINLPRKIALNILFAMAAGFLVWKCYKTVPSYQWVHNTLLRSSYKFASANKHLNSDQRREAKLGFDFRFLYFVKQSTPNDAVIWMPPRSAYFPEGSDSPFTSDIVSKLYRLRVLYPRKIVDAGDTGNCFAKQITHAAIINGVGYEQLDYTPQEKHPFTVLPIRNFNK